MDYEQAKRVVAEDVRRSYPDMTDDEAVEFVCDTMSHSHINNDDPTAEAYHRVLRERAWRWPW